MLPATILPPTLIDDMTTRYAAAVTLAAKEHGGAVTVKDWVQRGTERHGSLVWETRAARAGARRSMTNAPIWLITLLITPVALQTGDGGRLAEYRAELIANELAAGHARTFAALIVELSDLRDDKRLFHGATASDMSTTITNALRDSFDWLARGETNGVQSPVSTA